MKKLFSATMTIAFAIGIGLAAMAIPDQVNADEIMFHHPSGDQKHAASLALANIDFNQVGEFQLGGGVSMIGDEVGIAAAFMVQITPKTNMRFGVASDAEGSEPAFAASIAHTF